MAYSLFNSGAAAAYANSFRQRNPYGGFEDVKSDIGKETFGKIPFLNFKAELDMAKAGLKEVGATHRQHITNETSKEITEMKYGDKGGKGDSSAAKKAALARMLGSSGSVAKRSGGVTSNTLLQMLGNRRDPLNDAVVDTRLNAALDAEGAARMGPANAILKQAMGDVEVSVGGGQQLQVTPQQTPQVKVDPVKSLESKVKPEDIMQQVLQSNGIQLPPTPKTPGGEE